MPAIALPKEARVIVLNAADNVAVARDKIFIVGSTGTTCVVEPGRAGKTVAVNKIESRFTGQLQSAYNYLFKYWPEHLEGFITSPVFDGDRIYIRGEEFLYCIGER